MSSRKPGYLISIIVVALILTVPEMFLASEIVEEVRCGNMFVPLFSKDRSHQYFFDNFSYMAFWQDKFQFISDIESTPTGKWNALVCAVDPQTGRREETRIEVPMPGPYWVIPNVPGDRHFLTTQRDSFEIVDGTAQRTKFVDHDFWAPARFFWRGEVAHVSLRSSGFEVMTFRGDQSWESAGIVVLPKSDRVRMVGGEQIAFDQLNSMQCLNLGNRLHVFLHCGESILYREGLDLRPHIFTKRSDPLHQQSGRQVFDDQPASALMPANSDADLAGWSLACSPSNHPRPLSTCEWSPILIDERPALFAVKCRAGTAVGYIRRFDGEQWNEFASQSFPFGSQTFRAVSTRGGNLSYIVATTSTGMAYMYVVDAAGIRKTNGASEASAWRLLEAGFDYIVIFSLPLVLGTLLGAMTSVLMWWWTKSDYGFGHQTVKLASITRRGFARLIDLGLMLTVLAGLGWLLARDFDWLSFLEALNVRQDDPKLAHPTFPVACQIVMIFVACFIVLMAIYITAQSVWGVTPGKWCCGLRTMQTTLRPCGFARCLTREFVLLFECCYLLCWTPALVSIALTDRRQRLGDLVADTLVIKVHTLKSDLP